MRELGYLYVLANSAMPGLVKVGKTTRSPSERAGELSGATGLPTPFIVVYEQLFEDCGSAESFVHAYLTQNGYRVSDNREFFSAPVNNVVRAITLAPGAIDLNASQSVLERADDLIERGEPDELDSLNISQSEPSYPWLSVLAEAEAHYFGLGDCIQDYAEALRLFRQAAKLGALPAYGYIGRCYENGNGVRQDSIKALEVYKEGARKGSAFCHWAAGILFTRGGSQQNAEKCFRLFLQHRPASPDDLHLTERELDRIDMDCFYVFFIINVNNGKEPPAVLSEFIAEISQRIVNVAKRSIENDCSNLGEEARCRKVIEHLQIL